MGTEQGPQTAGKHGPHEREIASTLAALAAAAPSSGEHPGYFFLALMRTPHNLMDIRCDRLLDNIAQRITYSAQSMRVMWPHVHEWQVG